VPEYSKSHGGQGSIPSPSAMVKLQNIRRTIIVLMVMAILTYLGVTNSTDYVKHSDNQPYVLETAFNLGIDVDEVTQKQFAKRYLKWKGL